MFGHPILLLLISTLLFQGHDSFANVGMDYGMGSRTSAFGGAGAAYDSGAFSAYSNPASIANETGSRFQIEVGMLWMNPEFTPIRNVIVENGYVGDSLSTSPLIKDVDTNYRSTWGQTFGANFKVFPDWRNFSVGAALFAPMQQLAYMDSGEAFVPEYLLYRSRTQKPQVALGIALELGHGWNFGLGAQLAYSLTSSATAFLQTQPSKPSTLRFASSLKSKLTPHLGLHYQSNEPGSSFNLGAVIRLESSSPNEIYLKSAARAFGNYAALDFNFASKSTLFYDPLTIELGTSFATPFLEAWNAKSIAQLDYQAWKNFEAPTLTIIDPITEGCGTTSCGILISQGNNPKIPTRNIFIPRLGEEIQINSTTLRLGYTYKPSILSELPSNAGNALDPPKQTFTLGLGWKLPVQIDLHFAYSILQTQTITKTAGDESGALNGDRKIGSPGYEAGGKIYGGGITLGLAF